jgi:hypothetical protein
MLRASTKCQGPVKRWNCSPRPTTNALKRTAFPDSPLTPTQRVRSSTRTELAARRGAVCVPHAAETAEAASDVTYSAASSSTAEQESLDILEWPAVCKQVAAFCGTSVAAAAVAAGQLPIGKSQAESELLLQQTSEALAADLRYAHAVA